MTRTAWPLLASLGNVARQRMRKREMHFEQVPLEKVKMIVEKERQRQEKIKRAVTRNAAKRKRLNPEPPAK
jgi:hypothetical protein